MIVVRQLLRATSALARPMSVNTALLNKPTYTFAFMQLFERNKRPAELSPVFKRVTHEKGHLKSKARKQYSKKLNTRVRKPKQKLKNHKGLLKRIKIVFLPSYHRLVLVGTDSSNSNLQARTIFVVIRVRLTWNARVVPDMCTHPICAESRN